DPLEVDEGAASVGQVSSCGVEEADAESRRQSAAAVGRRASAHADEDAAGAPRERRADELSRAAAGRQQRLAPLREHAQPGRLRRRRRAQCPLVGVGGTHHVATAGYQRALAATTPPITASPASGAGAGSGGPPPSTPPRVASDSSARYSSRNLLRARKSSVST